MLLTLAHRRGNDSRERPPWGAEPSNRATQRIFIVGALIQLPGRGGTRIHCRALGRPEIAGASLVVALGPPGPRSPHPQACGGRTRPAKSKFNTGVALSQLRHTQPPYFRLGAKLNFFVSHGLPSSLTPGYTVTDVLPPKFTVRPSFLIRRFKPRAPGSPPRGGENKEPGGQER